MAYRYSDHPNARYLYVAIPEPTTGAYPDLTDWATVGILLGMVVEALPKLLKKITIGETPVELENWLHNIVGMAHGCKLMKAPGEALVELLLVLWGEK